MPRAFAVAASGRPTGIARAPIRAAAQMPSAPVRSPRWRRRASVSWAFAPVGLEVGSAMGQLPVGSASWMPTK